MKEGLAPLICALACLVMSATFLYIDHKHRAEAAVLASEVEAFLEDHRTESAGHFEAQRQARQLENIIRRPSRTFLTMLSSIMAVQFVLIFFGNPKGRSMARSAAEVWTRRP